MDLPRFGDPAQDLTLVEDDNSLTGVGLTHSLCCDYVINQGFVAPHLHCDSRLARSEHLPPGTNENHIHLKRSPPDSRQV